MAPSDKADRPRVVLHVINSLGLSGGAEQQLMMNFKHFTDESFEHRVAYLYTGPDISWLSSLSTAVVDLNKGKDNTSLPLSAGRLLRLVRDLRPSLIHCSLAEASLISRLVGWLTGTPVLESLVNISHEPIRTVDSSAVKLWKLRMHRAIDRVSMKPVTQFHALTDEVARSWVDTVGLPSDKVTVIPRGLSFAQLAAAQLSSTARADLRHELIGDSKIFVLAVGREEPQKGHRYLISAFSELIGRGLDAHLVMMGRSGSSSAALGEQIVEEGLDRRVTRLGVKRDVYRYMNAADMLVFPSLFEGLGVSLIEAMGCGLPAIVFDRPPMNQIVTNGQTGLVSGDRDIAGLADTMEQLASDPELASRLGEEAARYARTEFDIDTTTKRLEGLYHSLLDDLGPRGRG